MGLPPLQFPDGESAASPGLARTVAFGLDPLTERAKTLMVPTPSGVGLDARVRIDTPGEWRYFRQGDVLRQLRYGA
jgi:aconitate hydratase